MSFKRKMLQVCTSKICMTGSTTGAQFSKFMEAKLKSAVEEDPGIDNLYLAYEEQV